MMHVKTISLKIVKYSYTNFKSSLSITSINVPGHCSLHVDILQSIGMRKFPCFLNVQTILFDILLLFVLISTVFSFLCVQCTYDEAVYIQLLPC
jgi:hypothetical protein